MGWFTRKKHPEQRTLDRDSAGSLLGISGADQGPSASGALRISDAYACVRALSDAASSLPLHVYRRTPQGRSRVGGRAALLLERPSPATTTANLIGQMMAHLNLYGNAYIGKLRENGEITRLSLLHPDRVTPELKKGRLTFHVSTDNGLVETTEADIIHVKAMSTDGLVGLSPVAQARTALGLSRALTDHAAGTYANGGRPGGILKIQGGGKDAAERIGHSFTQKHGRPEAAGKIMVLSGDVDYTPLAMTFADAEFLESRRYSATEIARIFRVPPWIIGAETGGSSITYATVEGQAQHFVTFSLRPWLVLIEQALTADRDLCPGSTYVEFKLDGLLRADTATRAEVYTAALNPETGWMTRNEVRNLENLETE